LGDLTVSVRPEIIKDKIWIQFCHSRYDPIIIARVHLMDGIKQLKYKEVNIGDLAFPSIIMDGLENLERGRYFLALSATTNSRRRYQLVIQCRKD
jgi:hypothetical protein